MVLGDVFGPSDALVAVAALTALAAIIGPVALTLVSSLKRIRAAAETAAHNTGPNGVPDADGNRGEPSPYDTLIASHEYMIGQVHAVGQQAAEAARAAYEAQAAVKQNDVKTDALLQTVEAGFADAKIERDAISGRLDQNIVDGATFASAMIAGALDIVGRDDAIDGRDGLSALREQIDGGGK